MIPEFMNYYPYSLDQVLGQYARTFFTLVGAMYRLKAIQMIDDITVHITARNNDNEVINKLKEKSEGSSGILRQVKVIKK